MVEDLRPLTAVHAQREGLLRVVLGVRGRLRLELGQRAVGQGLHAVQILVLEGLHPGRRCDVAPVGDEEVLRPAEGAAHRLSLAHRRLCPGLDGVEHRPGARQHVVPGAGLGQFHQVEGVVGPSEMDHLTGRPGQRLAGPRPVAALTRRMGGDDEVLLGRRLQADVVRHPAREDREVGRDAPQAPLEMGGVTVGEDAAHLVELSHDSLALQPATAGRVPGPEHLDRELQFVDLLRADGSGLVAVEPGRVGVVEEGMVDDRSVGGEGGVGVQPLVHGTAECRARGERGTRAHQAASVEHEVHSREFGEDRGSPFGRPRHAVGMFRIPAARPLPCTPVPDQTEVLDGHDTAETLGEQSRQHPRHRIARDLSRVDPSPHPGGVGRQLGVAHGRRLPVDQPREFTLGPAGQAEQVRQASVGLSAHVKPPGSRLS